MVIGGVLLCLGLVWQMFSIQQATTQQAGLKAAETMSQQIKVFRGFYTQEILARAKRGGLKANFDYADHETVLPLPATLVHVLGNKVAEQFPGSEIKIYSNYPFPNRAAEASQDSFQAQSLVALEKNPETPVWKMEERNGRKVVRYVTAEVMKEGCVSCHNSHADSPKVDWSVGDVRGGIEVIVPVDDVAASMGAAVTKLLVFSVAGIALIIFGILWFIRRSVVRPVEIIKAAATRLADGDLSVHVDHQSSDELGQLVNAFNRMSGNLHDTLQKVTTNAEKLEEASEKMLQATEKTSADMNTQQAETNQVATAVTEMSATVQEVASNAVLAADAAVQANRSAQDGQQVMAENMEATSSLAGEILQAADVVQTLSSDTDSIGVVLDVIRDIADQTNLLALNAAIEAARAGEHGRGFAVVADEVRTLASRTQQSTEEIQEMIQRLQGGAKNAVSAMERGSHRATANVEQASKAAEALTEIVGAVTTISDMNTQIASAAEEQSAVTEEITRNINNINDAAEHALDNSREAASAGEALAGLAEDLHLIVHKFKM